MAGQTSPGGAAATLHTSVVTHRGRGGRRTHVVSHTRRSACRTAQGRQPWRRRREAAHLHCNTQRQARVPHRAKLAGQTSPGGAAAKLRSGVISTRKPRSVTTTVPTRLRATRPSGKRPSSSAVPMPEATSKSEGSCPRRMSRTAPPAKSAGAPSSWILHSGRHRSLWQACVLVAHGAAGDERRRAVGLDPALEAACVPLLKSARQQSRRQCRSNRNVCSHQAGGSALQWSRPCCFITE